MALESRVRVPVPELLFFRHFQRKRVVLFFFSLFSVESLFFLVRSLLYLYSLRETPQTIWIEFQPGTLHDNCWHYVMAAPSSRSPSTLPASPPLASPRDGCEKKKGLMFGIPLEEAVQVSSSDIPNPIRDVMRHILAQGRIDTEGIFRIPGSAEEVDQLRKYYDGEPSSCPEGITERTDVHSTCGLLKLFLRELPDPLLTFKFYEPFVYVQRNQVFDLTTKLMHMKNLLNALPEVNVTLLKELIQFLHKVAEHSAKNKMTMSNLAIVFGPELLRSDDDSMIKLLQNAGCVNAITKGIFEDFEFFYCGQPSKKLAEERRKTLDAKALLDGSLTARNGEELIDKSNIPVGTAAVRDGGEGEFTKRGRSGSRRRNVVVKIDATNIDWEKLEEEDLARMDDENELMKRGAGANKISSAPSSTDTDKQVEYGAASSSFETAVSAKGEQSSGSCIIYPSSRILTSTQMFALTLQELQVEKGMRKKELASFKESWKEFHGKSPTNADLLPHREQFQCYHEIKTHIAKTLLLVNVTSDHSLKKSFDGKYDQVVDGKGGGQGTPGNAPTTQSKSGMDDGYYRYISLLADKRHLQKMLQTYHNLHEKKGMKFDDEACAAVKKELKRYKVSQ